MHFQKGLAVNYQKRGLFSRTKHRDRKINMLFWPLLDLKQDHPAG